MANTIRMLFHMVFWGAAVTLCLNGVTSHREIVLYCLTMAFLAAGCYLMRERAKRILLFLGGHIFMAAAGIVAVQTLGLSIGYAAVLTVMVLYSIILRCAAGAFWLNEPVSPYIGILVVIYLLVWIYEGTQAAKLICSFSIILLFLMKFLYENLKSLNQFVEMQSLSASIDGKHVKGLSVQISLLYTAALGMLLGLIAFLSTHGIAATIKGLFMKFMAFIVGFIPTGTPQAEKTPQGASGGNGMLDMLQGLAEEKEYAFLKVLGEIFMILGQIAIIAATVYMLIRMVIAVYRNFNKRRMEKEENVLIEKLYIGKKSKKVTKRRIYGNTEQNATKRIRKFYKKIMKKSGQELKSFTFLDPDEQVHRLREEDYDSETKEKIRNLYEKARYGENIATDEEAEQMRQIM